MVELIKAVELLAVREGTYTMFVFKELDSGTYIMCTKLPNWQTPEIYIGNKGYLQYQIVKAGDEYITPDGEKITYRYSNVYFVNFVNSTDFVKNKEIIL